jgi:hypothetical protein
VVALLSTVALAVLAGCAANGSPITSYAPADGVLVTAGPLKVQNALVVAPEEGGDGVLSMTIYNGGTEAEQLAAVETDAGQVDYTGSRELPPGGSVTFGARSNPSVTISGLSAVPGEAIRLRLVLEQGEPVTIRTVVVPATGYYAEFTPAPAPSPSPGTGSPSAEVTATASESETAAE